MNSELTTRVIEDRIYTMRGVQVMIDRDLAELYGVETKRLNEAVKRNIERFPDKFRFQLTDDERLKLVANCDRFKLLKHSSSNPYVFTEQGIAMISAVLRSETAIEVSIRIMEAFVDMRRYLVANAQLFQRIDKLEMSQLETNHKLNVIFKQLEDKTIKENQGIFFDGQIFDAYVFISRFIKQAQREIILIDNYVDETVLTLLDKRAEHVGATIYTHSVTKQLKLDVDKHNSQYQPIAIKSFRESHDRFICIDEKVYHIGASLKDLGKKWFAFSLMEDLSPNDLIRKM